MLCCVMTLTSCDGLLDYLPDSVRDVIEELVPGLGEKDPPPAPHKCESICPECAMCMDADCTETACIRKCPGHGSSNKNWDDYNIITIAEAIELAKAAGQDGTSERYYLSGTVKTLSNPGYGEMTLADETGEIYVYGTYSSDGSLKYSEMTDKAVTGDEVLLHCILSTYNGQPQVKNARLIDYKHVEVEIDPSEYPAVSVAAARDAEAGEKVRVSGVVARITYANGMIPSGVILVEGNASIYVYSTDVAGQVSIGNKIEVAGSKAYWILESEKNNADKFGYKGCNQIEGAILVSNDNGNHTWTDGSFPELTMKELMEVPVTEDVTTQIYKVTALVKKVPGNGFTNYYFFDIDGETGAYTYTQCNGNDFKWLDEFDGEICTVYITLLNAKSTSSDCYFRILPVEVVDEGYTFNTEDAAKYAVQYHGVGQFLAQYTGNPKIELVTSVDSSLLGFEGATLTYSSSDTDVVYFEVVDGKVIFNCGNSGTATITVTGSYNGKTYSEDVEVSVVANESQDTVTIKDAIAMEIGEEVVIKGIVGPSAVNQPAFYLFDETGMIAVRMSNADDFATFTIGNEVVIKGKRDAWGKNGAHSQICISNATIEANYYGEHAYNTDFFITDKTAKEFYDLDENNLLEACNVYVLKVKVEFYDGAYSSGVKLISGDTSISVYSSGAGQYSWLKQFDGQEVTVELAPCNWNTKSYYASCVLAVVLEDGTKVYNDYNFK